MISGRLVGVGVGPGDPELMTLKAVRRLGEIPVIAFVAAEGRPSRARQIAAQHLAPGRLEINLALPMHPVPALAHAAYDEGAARIGAELERGNDVAVLCEGDPLLYGSFSQLFGRLGGTYPSEIVPGIVSFTAAAAAARRPLISGTETLTVLPATLPTADLAAHLERVDAAAIMKLGRHLPRVRAMLVDLGLLERAIYVEHVTGRSERVVRLVDLEADEAPYFSLILLPGGEPA